MAGSNLSTARPAAQKTYAARPSDVKCEWLLIDAHTLPIGRLASRVAALLRGKHKTLFTPHVDMGDAEVVINAEKVQATGNKEKTKVYHKHTGHTRGYKSITL